MISPEKQKLNPPFKEELVVEDFDHNEKFYGFKNNQEVLVRKRGMGGGDIYKGDVQKTAESLGVSRKLFIELNDKYKINTPSFETIIGHDNDPYSKSHKAVFIAAEKIHGVGLREKLSERDEKHNKEVENLFISLIRYFNDKFNNGGDYLGDIQRISQYMVGRTKKNPLEKIYMVDVDNYWFEYDAKNRDESYNETFYKTLDELADNIIKAEEDSGRKFDSARKFFLSTLASMAAQNSNVYFEKITKKLGK